MGLRCGDGQSFCCCYLRQGASLCSHGWDVSMAVLLEWFNGERKTHPEYGQLRS